MSVGSCSQCLHVVFFQKGWYRVDGGERGVREQVRVNRDITFDGDARKGEEVKETERSEWTETVEKS